jgi:hypothetical protein
MSVDSSRSSGQTTRTTNTNAEVAGTGTITGVEDVDARGDVEDVAAASLMMVVVAGVDGDGLDDGVDTKAEADKSSASERVATSDGQNLLKSATKLAKRLGFNLPCRHAFTHKRSKSMHVMNMGMGALSKNRNLCQPMSLYLARHHCIGFDDKSGHGFPRSCL